MVLKIGTRASKLALWQANWVAKRLQDAGASTEIITIETKGDKILSKSIAKIGSKGVFTEELEQDLEIGRIDIAVHSAKDMQSELPPNLQIIAFTEREQSHDVVVSFNKRIKLERLDTKYLIGTSSTRRVAMLRHYYGNVRTQDVRGNLQTRFKKMEEGHYDALILAYAGVKRMGFEETICQNLSPNTFTPAVGQGSMAIEAHESLSDEKRLFVRTCLNDEKTEMCIIAERTFLQALDGGCSVPVFGLATLKDDIISLQAGVISLDGKNLLRHTLEAPTNKAVSLGKEVANALLGLGGDEILRKIRERK